MILRLPAYLGVGLIYLYRYTLGALFPGGCKYHPSCSQYAIDALSRYGLLRGIVLAGWRLLRCNSGVYAESRLRPRARRRFRIARPARVDIRARNPCRRFLRRTFG